MSRWRSATHAERHRFRGTADECADDHWKECRPAEAPCSISIIVSLPRPPRGGGGVTLAGLSLDAVIVVRERGGQHGAPEDERPRQRGRVRRHYCMIVKYHEHTARVSHPKTDADWPALRQSLSEWKYNNNRPYYKLRNVIAKGNVLYSIRYNQFVHFVHHLCTLFYLHTVELYFFVFL